MSRAILDPNNATEPSTLNQLKWQYRNHMTVSRLFPNKMAVTMALFWVSLVLSIIGSNASGEFNILHSPDSLKFTGSGKTSESLLKEIFSAALGLSVEENSEWKGMYVVDPFNTPEAVVEIYIDGVSSLGHTGLKTKTYPLIVDEYEPDTYQGVKHRIKQRFTNGGNKIVNIKLTDVDELKKNIFGDAKKPKPTKLSLMHLKYNVEEDYHFLNELASLQAITTKIENGGIVPDNMIDFYNLRFRTLHPLCDFHGPNSPQTKEAKKLLGEAIDQLNKAFIKAYDGSVLVTLVTTDENETDDSYSSEYPAIFNIILWFAIVIIFSLIAIVYALMDMDPGRDSIIYRMTSTRMKKDN
ncbi:hypothetical protein HF086_010334 [Spodoptera exigua]|uniref:Renin receptor n=1 Tax=Spodoptera exigua TaxID=7107 RepID=A0A922M1Y0_SPOEX|nr:hypothetical protein HF086_010334 [Spodoptera exigua]